MGQVAGEEIEGSVDLYDRVTATVVDWKVVGPTSLKAKKRHGPGAQYRTQIHLYARGLIARGLPVDTVMIACLPQAGELDDAYIWSEPYDEAVALAGLARLGALDLTVKAMGAAAPGVLATTDAYCNFCPFMSRTAVDLALACPGHEFVATEPPASLAEALAS